MSCNNCEDVYTDCGDNPCYDNCGCLNPTTFECVSEPGAHSAIGVTNVMNGKEVLAAINTAIDGVKEDNGKVALDSADACPEFLTDKLSAGTNISIQETGSGCDRKLVIHASSGGVAVDVSAKVSSADTTAGPLNTKIDTGVYLIKNIVSPGGNEKLKIDVVPSTLISSDSGNALGIGGDGGLKTTFTAPDGTETKVSAGAGVLVTGVGSTANPYVISTNPSIQAARGCFTGTWANIPLTAYSNSSVVLVSGTPQYRIRHDGTIEMKGQMTFNVTFNTYSSGANKHVVTIGALPTSCLTLTEQAGTADLKGINYIDLAGAGDQIVQQYGYIIRKAAQNIAIEFQSAYIASKTKTIVVNFDGCISHPNI